MNYMHTVPYYATTPLTKDHIVDFIPRAAQGPLSGTRDLPCFGRRFDADLLGTACAPQAIDTFSPEGLRGGIFGDVGDAEVMILRMCVKAPHQPYRIPADFAPLLPLFDIAAGDFIQSGGDDAAGYVYATIRFGTAATTDHTWHTDGFQSGKKQDLKVPEVNYIWCDRDPTLFYTGAVDLSGVDFATTNVHSALDLRIEQDLASNTPAGAVIQAVPNGVYAMNPFVVHRKPMAVADGFRRFVRLTFCETEIQDDTCAPNPFLRMPTYRNTDARWHLT